MDLRADRADRASATAETAVVLPVLVLVLVACLWVAAVAAATLRCTEAARTAARAAARGEAPDQVRAAARRVSGPGAEVDVSPSGPDGLVTVRVSRRLTPPVPLLARLLGPLTVHQAATASVEPRAGPP